MVASLARAARHASIVVHPAVACLVIVAGYRWALS
jgi:hypothetical protein